MTSSDQPGAAPRTRGRPRGHRDTRALLADAALQEFCQYGYDGTDSNRIARRAGFAPQTFYRWFRDKAEAFVAAYHRWEEQEWEMFDALAQGQASDNDLVMGLIDHHSHSRIFRRSLRALAVENDQVRQARADSRTRQIARISQHYGLPQQQAESVLVRLLQIERLADAIADQEAEDLGFGSDALKAALIQLMDFRRV